MANGGKARVLRFEDAALGEVGAASGGSFSVGSEVFAAVLIIQRRSKVKTRQVRRDDVK
jgi:hypothetical protein